jgi:hypothetical protein
VAFPLLTVLLALGWGLLAELAAGRPLPGALLAPVGLAAMVVATQLITVADATAELAAPVVLTVAAGGLLLGRGRLRAGRLDTWQVGAAAGVFAAYAAPVVLSGSATFPGYGQLGDIADHFVIVDALMSTGASAVEPGLAPAHTTSAYDMAVSAYPGQGYPTGMHTALGAARALGGQDVAWVFQPFLALVMALSALALLPLVASVLESRRTRALAVGLASLPALTYGYALQGSIKELGTIWVLALLGGLLPWYARARPGLRRVVPVVLATGASFGVVGISIIPWLGPLLLLYVWAAMRRDGRWHWRAGAIEITAFALVSAVIALPTLTQLGIYVEVVAGTVTRGSELGNLLRPLSIGQALPAWPMEDFRLAPGTLARWLAVGAAGVAAALGAVAVLRRPGRHWALLGWLMACAIGWAYVTLEGSPWADAKALAIVAPAVALTAAIGALSLAERGLRAEGAMVAVLLTAAVLWSLGLQVQGTPLASRDRLEELADLGPRLRGPTLHPQFEPFAKHFLRQGEPDSLTEPYPGFRLEPQLRPGVQRRQFGFSYDIDDLAPGYVRRFRTIVVRRGPGSRPPAIYRRVWRGRYYEAWERPPGAERRWDHVVPAGNGVSAAGRPDCAAVRALARATRRGGGQLVAYPRARAVVWVPARATRLPSHWAPDAVDPMAVVAPNPGAVRGTLHVPTDADYELWLASSLGAEVTVSIDDRDVGRLRGGVQPRGQFLPVGQTHLGAGRHTVAVRRGSPGLRPGAEGGSRLIGPLVLERTGALDGPLLTVRSGREGSLCRRSVDWVQAPRP